MFYIEAKLQFMIGLCYNYNGLTFEVLKRYQIPVFLVGSDQADTG